MAVKDIRTQLVELLEGGYCTPQIARLARKLKKPSTTLHYNINKLEEEAIKTYKAVFDYKAIGKGFTSYLLISLSEESYSNPEQIGARLAKNSQVESVDICTGDYELVIKVRVKDQEEYYAFIKHLLASGDIRNTKSLISFKQLKSEFIE